MSQGITIKNRETMMMRMGMTSMMMMMMLLIMIGETNASFQLAVLHTNDIHARIQEINKYNGLCDKSTSLENKCFGGYARIKTMVDKLRSEHTNTILVDGGDQYQGTLWFYLYGGKVMSHFMNLIGYDAMGVGNHEFDKGPDGLVPFLENVTFPVLSANIDVSSYRGLGTIKNSTVITKSGEKIGIIGYTTTDAPYISDTGNVKFHSEIDSIQKEADRLKAKGVKIIVAIGHAGYRKDIEIAKNVVGVDVVVGGHSNTFLYTGKPPTSQTPEADYPTVVINKNGQKVLVVQDYAYGKYLGKLIVDFDDEGNVESWAGNPILLDSTVYRDDEILKAVNAYLPEIEMKQQEIIGTSLVDLIGHRSQCRRYECNMGNLIADSMVRQNLRHSDGLNWSNVTIAFVNAGAIRASLKRGKISMANVLAVQPFGNTVNIVEVTGNTILGILELCASQRKDLEDGWGGYLQMAGIRVVYDQNGTAGNRVYSVDVLCADCLVPEYKPLRKRKRYQVLMSAFLMEGGDGYDIIKDNVLKTHTIGNLDADIMMDYIKENTPITTGLEGRITFLGKKKNNKKICQ